MTQTLTGDRIGKQGTIRLGCSAVLFDESGQNVLLTRRADNGEWCLPGGGIEPGESMAEACEREFFEETRLKVRVKRLTGVYSSPNMVIVYPDGNTIQVVSMNFLVEKIGGELGLSDETTEARFVPVSEAVQMKLFHSHAERIRDAVSGQAEAFIK
jgi:ADP-ribose pyrophosphatase YjhB (NUDIX family)